MSNISTPLSNRLLIKPRGMFSIGGESVDPNLFTQNFDAYAPGVSLATLPGWNVNVGEFVTVAGGYVWANLSSYCLAGYSPAGFTVSPNHEAEVQVVGASAGTGASHGVVAAMSPTGSCYLLMADVDGYVYFGARVAGNVAGNFLFVSVGALLPNIRLRLRVTGTGAGRRVTASYNIGAGWIVPSGWQDRDFGAISVTLIFDGGTGGIEGASAQHLSKLDYLTIRNLP